MKTITNTESGEIIAKNAGVIFTNIESFGTKFSK